MTISWTRRRVLGTGVAGAAAITTAACGIGSESSSPTTAVTSGGTSPTPTSDDFSDTEKVINFSNWPGYIDIARKNFPTTTLEDFTSETGIDVVYTEDINDSNEFFAKVRIPLEQGQDIGRDIVVLTEEGVELWIAFGYAQKLNRELIPNAVNVIPGLADPPFDPGRQYSLPWQSGFTGFGWNTPLLKERTGLDSITSFEQFFAPELAGRITILSEMRDTMGLLMNWQGYDMANFTNEQFTETLQVLQSKIDDGSIRQVAGNDYLAALDSGDAIVSIGWSGDVLALGGDFNFAMPETGGMIWADNMLVPVNARHKKNAEELMNFYYQPDIAARLAQYVQYVCPVEGAREEMAKIAPKLVDDPWIFPTPELLNQAQEFMTLSIEEGETLEREFYGVVGA
ncbi:MAG: spermidine/putrescine ABC transporter substrate-binding protein [Candidatus Nanopelagicales bacterium]